MRSTADLNISLEETSVDPLSFSNWERKPVGLTHLTPTHPCAVHAAHQEEERPLLCRTEGGGDDIVGPGHGLHCEHREPRPVEARGLLGEILRGVLIRGRHCQQVEADLILFGTLQLDVDLAWRVQLELVARVGGPGVLVFGMKFLSDENWENFHIGTCIFRAV